jgi:multicomponent Na+:H+ antiporter subunit C
VSTSVFYALVGVAVFCLALYGILMHPHLLRKIIMLNVLGSGVFLVLLSLAYRGPDAPPDPVPHAMVLTGVVVSVSATALALALLRRLLATGAKPTLSGEEEDGDA